MAVPPRFSAPSRLAPWLASALLLAGIAAALLVADGRSLPAGEADRDEPLPGAEGPAPDFSLTLLDGRSFTLSEHLARDGRPVVLNFWASWCLPCREEMPTLDRAAGRHPGILFLGVAVEDDPTAAREFADEIAVRYPLAIDESGAMAAR